MSQDLVRLLNDTDLWWSIGKGRVRRDEPLFGCIIQEPGSMFRPILSRAIAPLLDVEVPLHAALSIRCG